MKHELKTWSIFMKPIITGKKTFEVRRNDRNFEVGDILLLQGWYQNRGTYSGEIIEVEVTYILNGPGFGIEKDFCVMGIKVNN